MLETLLQIFQLIVQSQKMHIPPKHQQSSNSIFGVHFRGWCMSVYTNENLVFSQWLNSYFIYSFSFPILQPTNFTPRRGTHEKKPFINWMHFRHLQQETHDYATYSMASLPGIFWICMHAAISHSAILMAILHNKCRREWFIWLLVGLSNLGI